MESAFDDERGLSVIVDPQNPGRPPATLVVDRQTGSSTGGLEMGSLFVQAQRFADQTADEAERNAQEVISAAEAKAAEIIQRAPLAGPAPVPESAPAPAGAVAVPARPTIAPEAIANLSAAIAEFADTNRTLTAEIVKLRQAIGESYMAVPEAHHFQPGPTAATSNTSNGTVLPPANG